MKTITTALALSVTLLLGACISRSTFAMDVVEAK
jgi:hypothetical protein